MSHSPVRQIVSDSYGIIEIDESQLFHFPKGILGFPEQHEYALIQVDAGPFYILHAVDEQLSFILLPAHLAKENYGFHIDQGFIELLDIKQPEDVMTFVILNVIDDQLYANLKAPLILNRINHRAAQYILDDASYPLRYPLAQGGLAGAHTEA